MTIVETPPIHASDVRVSPVFAGIVAVFVLVGVRLWTAASMNRVMIFAFVVCGWLVSLCLHEFAHAYTAYKGGDRSVADKGYLTLNPLRYSNPVLSIVLPLAYLVIGGIGLPGGAVYIDRSALRSKRRASLVAAAGPLTNLGLAFALFLPFLVMSSVIARRHPQFQYACAALGVLEVVAAVLNLIPVPPLDGFGIIDPLFTDLHAPPRRTRPVVFPFLLVLLLYPGSPNTFLWRTSYRTGYAMGVPRGVAGDGIQLARFWGPVPAIRPIATQPVATPTQYPGVPTYGDPTPTTVFPKMQVVPGGPGTPYKPLFKVRGTGSQTSPPLAFPTTDLTGGVENDGGVTVWIVPVGHHPDATTIPYYTNGAGSGGAVATLAQTGTYVVVVEAKGPDVHWTVDIADSSVRR